MMDEFENHKIIWTDEFSGFGGEKTCPVCSQMLSDLNETYFVGCSNCYKVFESEIEALARNYHGRCEHVGKTPKKDLTRAKVLAELAELSNQEKEAVSNRDYMRAEEIKRKIIALRGNDNGSF